MFPHDLEAAAADVMVLQWSEATEADALALASELRGASEVGRPWPRVVLYPEVDKPGKQFEAAEGLGVPSPRSSVRTRPEPAPSR